MCFSVVDDRLEIFDEMSASEELDDNQVRQILFDLDSAYNAFNRVLHDHWSVKGIDTEVNVVWFTKISIVIPVFAVIVISYHRLPLTIAYHLP